MKTAEVKTTANTIQRKNETAQSPFFQKGQEGTFFSNQALANDTSAQPFFSPSTIQPKLTIGQPNDKYEIEADQMADKVVQRLSDPAIKPSIDNNSSPPAIQHKCSDCEENERIQKMEGEEEMISKKEITLQRKPMFESGEYPPEDNIVQTKVALSDITPTIQRQEGAPARRRPIDRFDHLHPDRNPAELLEQINPPVLERARVFCTQNCPATASTLHDYLRTGEISEAHCSPMMERESGFGYEIRGRSRRFRRWRQAWRFIRRRTSRHGQFVVVEGDRVTPSEGLTRYHFFIILNIRNTRFVVDAFLREVSPNITSYIRRLETRRYSIYASEFSTRPVIQRKPIFETDHEKNPGIQRKCTSCGKEEDDHIQEKSEVSAHNTASSGLQSQLNSSKGGGSAMSKDTASSMGSAFGADFSGVRIHTGSQAVQMNQELGAQAFTHGSDIYFNQGKYDTSSTGGKHLLAHELTHTLQQGGGEVASKIQKQEKVDAVQMADKMVQRLSKNESSTTDSSLITPHSSLPVVQHKCSDCEENEGLQKMEGDEDTLAKKEIIIQRKLNPLTKTKSSLNQTKLDDNSSNFKKLGSNGKSEMHKSESNVDIVLFPSLGDKKNQKTDKKENAFDLLDNLRSYYIKEANNAIEKKEVEIDAKNLEARLDRKTTKSHLNDILERDKIQKKIVEKTKDYKALKAKNKKGDKAANKLDNLDFVILNLKIDFNKLNDKVKYTKGYYNEAKLTELKKKDISVPNIKEDYSYDDEVVKKKKFDPKKTALKLINIYINEGELKPQLSTNDKKIILKYYKDGKNSLFQLQRFIQLHVQSTEEIKAIFGDAPNQLNPNIFIKLIEQGVHSKFKTITKESKDKTFVESRDLAQKEGANKFYKAGKLSDKVEKKNASKRQIKKLKRLKKKGFTGDYGSKNVKQEYAETMTGSELFLKEIKKIKKDIDSKGGLIEDGKTKIKVLGKETEITDLNEVQITEGQLKAQIAIDKALFDLAHPPTLLTPEEKEEYEKPLRTIIEDSFEAKIKPHKDKISGEILKELEKRVIPDDFIQNSLLPYWNNNKLPLIIGGGALGAGALYVLGELYLDDEIEKIKNNDFGSLASALSFVPDQTLLKGSFGKEYSFGGKDYKKTTYSGKLKSHQKKAPPLFDKSLSGLMRSGESGEINDRILKESYTSYLSPKFDLLIKDEVKKSGDAVLRQNLNIYLDNRIYLRSIADLGPIQTFTSALGSKDLGKIKKAIEDDNPNEFLHDKAADQNKSTYDFKFGSNYSLIVGNQKIKVSGDYISLNNFDIDKETMRRLAFNAEYENKISLDPNNSLKFTAKGGFIKRDTQNNYNLEQDQFNTKLGLSYNLGNPKKGKATFDASLNYTHKDTFDPNTQSMKPTDARTLNLGTSYKGNSKYLPNNFYQFELGAKFISDFKGGNSLKIFLIIRPRG